MFVCLLVVVVVVVVVVVCQIMRNLLGTHLAHSGVQTMCCIMEDTW